MKIDLYFENDGNSYTVENRKPFLNGIPKNLVSKVIITPKGSPAECYFGMFDGSFRKIFSVNTSIPENKKFFYPIIFSLSALGDYAKQITIQPEIVKLINENWCKILLVCPYEGWPWRLYDKVIDGIIKKYKIKHSHIVLMTAKLNDHPKCKVVYYNNWEVAASNRRFAEDRLLGRTAVLSSSIRPYKFICLNRRATVHRFGTVSQLWPYRDQGLLSFWQHGFHQNDTQYIREQKNQFYHNMPILAQSWITQRIDNHMPLALPADLDPYDSTDNKNNPTSDPHSKKFYNSYLHIVTETTMSDEGFFSEKIFKPAIYFQPFVLIGQKHGLENLRKIGYKTFSNVIDESYDLEPDNQTRLIKATNAAIEFTKIVNNDLMRKLLPILEHNAVNFMNRAKTIISTLQNDLASSLEN